VLLRLVEGSEKRYYRRHQPENSLRDLANDLFHFGNKHTLKVSSENSRNILNPQSSKQKLDFLIYLNKLEKFHPHR